jgi:adenine-specific DNA-methyltransferase
MVSSRQVTVSLLEGRVFDQSIVGVFPHDLKLVSYLLAFFNSPTCNKLLRTINPSANNSANYVKKIPFILPDNEIIEIITLEIEELIKELKQGDKYEIEHELRLNQIIKDLYGF